MRKKDWGREKVEAGNESVGLNLDSLFSDPERERENQGETGRKSLIAKKPNKQMTLTKELKLDEKMNDRNRPLSPATHTHTDLSRNCGRNGK